VGHRPNKNGQFTSRNSSRQLAQFIKCEGRSEKHKTESGPKMTPLALAVKAMMTTPSLPKNQKVGQQKRQHPERMLPLFVFCAMT
jgi:hypothetical protein